MSAETIQGFLLSPQQERQLHEALDADAERQNA